MSHANSKPFFTLETFSAAEFVIEGTNLTSQIKIPGGPSTIELIEIFEAGVLINLPPRSCAIGHTLSLMITVKQPNALDNKIQIRGIVKSLEQNQAKLKFREYSKEDWQKLLKTSAEIQLGVNELIKVNRK